MSTYLTRLPQSPFGAPILDDYGQDDLSGEIFDADVALRTDEVVHTREVVNDLLGMTTTARKREPHVLVAEFDTKAPARPRRGALYEEWSVAISRQPDFWDDGKAWWIGEHGAVGYNGERWAQALSVTEDHGSLSLQGVTPDQYGLVVMPHYDGLWATQAFAKPELNHAYMLWTIAQSTLSN